MVNSMANESMNLRPQILKSTTEHMSSASTLENILKRHRKCTNVQIFEENLHLNTVHQLSALSQNYI